MFLFIYFFPSRSTNPPHQRQTRHQQPALATSRPHPRALCLPPPRPKATPPCPQPQPCTTPPATVAYPPISVSGMCRTKAETKHHTLIPQHGTIRQEIGTRAREGHTNIFLSIFYLILDPPREDDDYQQRGKICIIVEVCFILYKVTKSPLSHWL